MGKHRLHVVSLPHTRPDGTFTSCAYTEKVRKFCKMMTERGHFVHLLTPETFDPHPVCSMSTFCCTEEERAAAVGNAFYTSFPFDPKHPHWARFNAKVMQFLKTDLQPKDIICFIAGSAQYPIMEAFPEHLKCEFGIGYTGIAGECARVWESYAWMHSVYGHQKWHAGSWYDRVIPNFFEPEQFTCDDRPREYFLCMGRQIPNKGFHVAQETCKRIGARLIIAGSGPTPSGYGEFVGPVGAEKRRELLAGAIALFSPSLYIEPFGGVVIEAHLSGTPALTTDWGAYPETVVHDFNGRRCHSLQDFLDAAAWARELDAPHRQDIARFARGRYSCHVIAGEYERYFDHLVTLKGDGWYTLRT